MTLPSDIHLPFYEDEIRKDPVKYIRSLIYDLEDMYSDIAFAVNGNIKEAFSSSWTPTIYGSTISGNPVYNHQSGIAVFRNLMVEVWFDIDWSDRGGAGGNLIVDLPYTAININNRPFVGIIEPSGITFTAGTDLYISVLPGTNKGEIWCKGDVISSQQQQVPNSGKIIGHVRYRGEAF